MSFPSLIASQTINSGGSATSSSIAFAPRVAFGAAQSIAGAAAGTGGAVDADASITAVCTNPSNATPLTKPANAQLQLSLDNSTWVTVASYTFSSVPLFTDSCVFDLEVFTGKPSSYGQPGSTPIAWQYARITINGAVGGSIVAEADQGSIAPTGTG